MKQTGATTLNNVSRMFFFLSEYRLRPQGVNHIHNLFLNHVMLLFSVEWGPNHGIKH